MSELVQLTGLWKGKDKNDKPMLSGYFGNARVIILLNSFKKEDKHPDYYLYVTPQKKREEGPPEDEDDIPF